MIGGRVVIRAERAGGEVYCLDMYKFREGFPAADEGYHRSGPGVGADAHEGTAAGGFNERVQRRVACGEVEGFLADHGSYLRGYGRVREVAHSFW